MAQKKFKRKRLWVDPAFQCRLLARMAVYFVVFVLLVVHLGFAFELIGYVASNGERQGIDQLYFSYLDKQRAVLISLVLFTPLLLYDLLKFSHRIAGPLFRCRKVMDDMAQGKPVPEFVPRTHDLMRELFASFNALIKQSNSRVKEHANEHANAPLPHANGTNGKIDATTLPTSMPSAGAP